MWVILCHILSYSVYDWAILKWICHLKYRVYLEIKIMTFMASYNIQLGPCFHIIQSVDYHKNCLEVGLKEPDF